MGFNLVDLLLAFFFSLALFKGWRTGFLGGAARVGSVAAALLAAWTGTPWLADAVARPGWLPEPWASPAAFVLILFVVLVPVSGWLFQAVAGRARSNAAQAIDHAFGLLPGVVNGAVTVMVVAALLTTLPLEKNLNQAAQDSVVVAALAEPIDWVDAQLAPVFSPALQRVVQLVTPPEEPAGAAGPGSGHGAVTLPFTVGKAAARPELEAAMLALVNAERVRAGGRPLVADPETVGVARAHGRDMFARGYFSHQDPEGASPFDRLRAAGIRYRTAGENLALSPTLQSAHDGVMKSPGHRENILNPAFGRLGIGIVDGGRRGLMVTQLFRN